MTEKIKNFYNPDRHDLSKLAPIVTPYKINIEPTNLCNIGCVFCPTADHELVRQVRPQGVMSFDLFKKIVDDLHEFPDKIKLMELYQDGEPLVNKNFPEMARYLADSSRAEFIKTKSNGLLLTPELIDRLAESGLGMIAFSVIAPTNEGYQEIAGRKVSYPELVMNIGRLHQAVKGKTKIHVKMTNVDFTQEQLLKFYEDFDGLCDTIAVEELHGWSMTDVKDFSLGTLNQTDDAIVCPYPFYQLTINWNGAVRTCCVDWAWKTTVGDVTKHSVKEVWESYQLNEFRKLHLTGNRRKNSACATCTIINQRLDNLDDARLEILSRLPEVRE
jgi:radical SAM protein with 4Fe4S-binding SPASM domain